ncbi:vicilin-like seed storage protein At2g18540 isoform X3 [Mizuhopecten yessoensis]|uniref:vicilin-like seed storage protein At2g18540 isoform X3 n=1 Tax=Mizuhopecten yessoensis TaxID=6573 RepID=UPI000B45E800|nr:vicilin-like seed storage protein At2g18540 isoform X3 [Mizuhopecten yessoensis]
MDPIFVAVDTALLQHLEYGDNLRRLSECDTGSALELQDVILMEILQDMCVFQHYYTGDGAINTSVLDRESWETLDLSTLSITFVPNGAYIYVNTGCDDLGSTVEHQQLVSDVDQYAGYMEEMFVVGNVFALEASDPAQDWISQQMIKPHVRVLQDMLKFTDVQIKFGLENLRRRGEEITFMSLLDTLILTEDAVVNVYVGTRKYAFSADVKLVLHECFDQYQREPTMAEFDEEWNRIKGTGIEHLINLVNIERTRADTAQTEKLEAMRQTNTAMEDRNDAQQVMNAAIEEIIQAQNREGVLVDRSERAEEEKRRAEEEKRRAEEEIVVRKKNEQLLEEEKRRAEEEKRRAEEENVVRRKREQLLEEELACEKMRKKIRAELYEQEKRKFEEEKAMMAAQFEEERRTLLLRIQQISGCAQA